MPFVTAMAASLTFGACGGNDKASSPDTGTSGGDGGSSMGDGGLPVVDSGLSMGDASVVDGGSSKGDGGSDGGASAADGGVLTTEQLVQLAAKVNQTSCTQFNACFPSSFAKQFSSVKECEDYYAGEYSKSYFDMLIHDAMDGDACRTALSDAWRCYDNAYANLSCDEVRAYYTHPNTFVDPCVDEEHAVDSGCN